MPVKPVTYCAAPGCSNTVEQGRCREHNTSYERSRSCAAKRGYGEHWRNARSLWLKRHPLCVEHLSIGLIVSATEVDHLVPHRGDKALFWDRANWQSLCKSCHSRKTLRGE